MDRIPLDALRARIDARWPEALAALPPYRGQQRPRDRESLCVMIALADAAWRRDAAAGKVRWISRDRLELRIGDGPAEIGRRA